MLPPVPRSAFFPLRAEVVGSSARLRTPRGLYVRRGLIGVFLMPLAVFLLCLVVFASFVDESTPSVEGVFTAVAGSLSGASVIYGLIMIAASTPLAARTEIVINADRRSVRRTRDGVEVAWTSVATVRARKRPGLSGFWALELIGRNGDVLLSLHERLQPTHGRDRHDRRSGFL